MKNGTIVVRGYGTGVDICMYVHKRAHIHIHIHRHIQYTYVHRVWDVSWQARRPVHGFTPPVPCSFSVQRAKMH